MYLSLSFMQGQVPTSVVNVVRHLRYGNIPDACAAFLRVPRNVQAAWPSLHEALVLSFAHIPDAHAAEAVVRDMPCPTVAAYSHLATAYCREHNTAAAVSLLESQPNVGLPVDPRVIETVSRYVRKQSRQRCKSDAGDWKLRKANSGTDHHLKRPRICASEPPSLLLRLKDLARVHASTDPGLASVSVSSADFFEENIGGDEEEWVLARVREHERSLVLGGSVQNQFVGEPLNSRGKRLAPSTGQCSTGSSASRLCVSELLDGHVAPFDAVDELRKARGSLSRIDDLWGTIRETPSLLADTTIVAAAVASFQGCGWRGRGRALDVVSTWLEVHSPFGPGPNENASSTGQTLLSSPTQRAMLLTAVTSALATSASTAPLKALRVCDAVLCIPGPTFRGSLPLISTMCKVLRHCHLPLEQTVARIRDMRRFIVQLDEQGFSIALSAILESKAPPAEKWSVANEWVAEMRFAGITLTLHSYNAFAEQLRFMNDPELATSLLRDIAQSGLTPTAYTYSLMFDSCVVSGRRNQTERRPTLPSDTLLRVLRIVEGHMSKAGVSHSQSSRFALAKAYAHLGCEEVAVCHFERVLENMDTSALATTGNSSSPATTESTFPVLRKFNQMIYSFAHSRCKSPGVPEAAFRIYDRMRGSDVSPDGNTLQNLLAACVRIGNNEQAIRYVTDISGSESKKSAMIFLGRSGIESVLAVLAKSGSVSVWATCEQLLSRSFDVLGAAHRSRTTVSQGVVELAVLAYARHGHRAVCQKLCSMSGYPLEESCWELLLSGQGDFQRARSARSGRRLKQQQPSLQKLATPKSSSAHGFNGELTPVI